MLVVCEWVQSTLACCTVIRRNSLTSWWVFFVDTFEETLREKRTCVLRALENKAHQECRMVISYTEAFRNLGKYGDIYGIT